MTSNVTKAFCECDLKFERNHMNNFLQSRQLEHFVEGAQPYLFTARNECVYTRF